jgi:hypothetical protein
MHATKEDILDAQNEAIYGSELEDKAFAKEVRFLGSNKKSNDLAEEYDIDDFLEDNNVQALIEYEYALLIGLTVSQARGELEGVNIIDIMDTVQTTNWSGANKEEQNKRIEEAITTAALGMVQFLKIADGLHWGCIALLPDSLTPGVIKVVYMNSAYGKGAEKYLRCKLTGLDLLSWIINKIEATDDPNKSGVKLKAEVMQVYLNPTQQLGNNCGIMIAINIAALAYYWNLKAGNNIDINEFASFLINLRPNRILSSTNAFEKKSLFTDYVRQRFKSIRDLGANESPKENSKEVEITSETKLTYKLVHLNLEAIQAIKFDIGEKENTRAKEHVATVKGSEIEKQISTLPSHLVTMVFDVIEQHRMVTEENIGKEYSEIELRAAFEQVNAVAEKQKSKDSQGSKPTQYSFTETPANAEARRREISQRKSEVNLEKSVQESTKAVTNIGKHQPNYIVSPTRQEPSVNKRDGVQAMNIIAKRRENEGKNPTQSLTEMEFEVSRNTGKRARTSSWCEGQSPNKRLKVETESELYGELKAGGLKNTLHGDLFQLALLTLAASRAQRTGKKFYLTSEAEEFEKFDDLVIDCGSKITFLQAKHSFKADGQYTKADFCASVDNDASLAKYFDSWMKLRKSRFCQFKDYIKPTRYIFFTNRTIKNHVNFLESCSIEDDEFLFEGLDTKTLRFKKGDCRQEFIDAIRSYSEEVRNTQTKEEIELDDFAEEIEKAGVYLKKKYGAEKVQIDGKARLSKKTMAIIKLSLTNDITVRRVFIKTKLKKAELEKFITWLRKEVSVKGDSIEEALCSKLGREIDEFLDELTIKIEQPNQGRLFEVIKEELSIDTDIGSYELFNTLFCYMFSWLANPNSCVLNSRTYNRFIKASKADLERFYFLESTKLFEETYYIPYNAEGLDLEIELLGNYLDCDEVDNPIALVYDDEDGAKQRINLTIQSLKSKDKNSLKSDEWIYSSFNLKLLDIIFETFKNNITKFIVIDCTNSSIDDIENLISGLLEALTLNSRKDKKIVLIVNKGLEVKELETLTDFKTFSIPKLEDAQIQAICKSSGKESVTIAGKPIELVKIIEHKDNGVYELMQSLDNLNQVLYEENRPEIVNSMPYGVYVLNDLVKGIPYYNLQNILLDITAEMFIIEGLRKSDIKARFSGQFEFIDYSIDLESSKTSEDEKVKYYFVKSTHDGPQNGEKAIFLAEGVLEDIPNRPYIHIKVINRKDLFVIVIGKSEDIWLPKPLNYNFSSTPVDDNRIPPQKPGFSIISAKAGLGKSSYYINERDTWLKAELKKVEPFWVIRVNLPRLSFKDSDPDVMSAFTKYSTDFDWPSWQIQALEADMKKYGMVRLLLDGLDEVKDEKDVAKFNNWIRKIPKSVDIILTTRPYAAHKVILPKSRTVDNYLTLKPYTENQHREYINLFISAITKELRLPLDKPKEIIDGVYEIISEKASQKARSLLGIPLESYIFCEALKPYILEKAKDLEFDIRQVFEESGKLNIVRLYQLFVAAKLRLFLVKHMEISLETTLRDPYRIYSFSANYIEILMVYAYKQAFNLPKKTVLKHLKNTHYNPKMLKDISDTGLASITILNDEPFINFNHETYQEYFSALFLLKGMTNRKGKTLDEIENIIKEARYKPKYRVIISMLAQLSLIGDPLINGWDARNKKQIIKLWSILFSKGDLLGSATLKLFYDCVSDLTLGQKLYLKSVLEDNPLISREMLIMLDSGYKPKKAARHNLEDQIDELPYLPEDENDDTSVLSIEDLYDIEEFKEGLKDGNRAPSYVLVALENNVDPFEIADLMEEIIEVAPQWWDCNGGILAIALLGYAFSGKLAKYYLERMNKWKNNAPHVHRGITILLSMLTSSKYPDVDVFFRCFDIAKRFLAIGDIEYSTDIINILRVSSTSILKEIASSIDAEFSMAEVEKGFLYMLESKNLDQPITFDLAVEKIFTACYLAHVSEYALVINKDQSKIIIYCDSEIEIKVSDIQVQDMFNRLLHIVDRKLQDWRRKPDKQLYDICDVNTGNFYESALAKLTYKESYQKGISGLARHNSWRNEKDYWALNDGIQIVGFIGRFFNIELANRLIERSQMWENNCENAIYALQSIYRILAQVPVKNRDKHYKTAVIAYNYCIEEVSRCRYYEYISNNELRAI